MCPVIPTHQHALALQKNDSSNRGPMHQISKHVCSLHPPTHTPPSHAVLQAHISLYAECCQPWSGGHQQQPVFHHSGPLCQPGRLPHLLWQGAEGIQHSQGGEDRRGGGDQWVAGCLSVWDGYVQATKVDLISTLPLAGSLPPPSPTFCSDIHQHLEPLPPTHPQIESVHLLHSASGCSDKAPEGPPVPVVITAAGELAPGTALDDTNAPLLRGGGYPMWAEDQVSRGGGEGQGDGRQRARQAGREAGAATNGITAVSGRGGLMGEGRELTRG